MLLGHAADIIEENYGYGLAILGEGRLESFHKLMKRFRDRLSRKTNLKDNLHDIFSRLYLHSSPFIRSKRPKREKNLKVNIFEESHTILQLFCFLSERFPDKSTKLWSNLTHGFDITKYSCNKITTT